MILEICQKAKVASAQLAKSSAEQRNRALCYMADSLEKNCAIILEANQKDLDAARAKANEILAEANKKSQELLTSSLSYDDIKSECRKMIEIAEREAEEEVKKARQTAEEIKTGSEKKVDEMVNRMVKQVTGA